MSEHSEGPWSVAYGEQPQSFWESDAMAKAFPRDGCPPILRKSQKVFALVMLPFMIFTFLML